LSNFHLCFPVRDLQEAKLFYGDHLGFKIGRQSSRGMVIDMAGNQVVARLNPKPINSQKGIYPFHFGLIFDSLAEMDLLAKKAEAIGCIFYQNKTKRIRNLGSHIENQNFFIKDPSENWLEFKFYKNSDAVLGAEWIDSVGE